MLSGCLSDDVSAPRVGDARLRARPSTPTEAPPVGVASIPITLGVSGLVYFPPTYKPSTPAPVAFLLHGAGQDASELMAPVSTYAESRGLVLAAVTSSQGTWDAIYGGFGPDVRAIDVALNWLFGRCNVDTKRLGVMGFSDGATYALSIGLINGDVFTHVVGHSAGFIIGGTRHGRPKVFLSHGRQDTILPIDQCGRRIAAQLKREGYDLRFDEFDGGHTASAEMRERAIQWFVG